MTRTREVILRWAIKKTLKRRCPERIPRSGEEGKAVNCFTVHLRNPDASKEITVDSLDGDQLEGRAWSGKSFDTPITLSISAALEYEVQIEHFYGLEGVTFKNLSDFLLHQLTRLIYLRIHTHRSLDAIAQFAFNRRSLGSKKRFEILQYLLSQRQSGNDRDWGPFVILNNLYSKRWMRHPDWRERLKAVTFVLDSLVASGDVEKVGTGYRATTKAATTMESVEEVDRRHREISRLQLWVLVFTAVLAAAAVIQAITSLRRP